MSKTLTYRSTMVACYFGYVTQAIIVNLMPLLFVTFQKEFAVTLDKLGLLVTVMFVTQLLVDLVVTAFSRWFPFRRTGVAAQVLAVLGLLGLCVLPGILPDPYVGLLVATVLLSVGGGLIEVLISPITDAIPSQSKVGAMSLLHSFYCWGFLGVVLLSTLFFVTVGTAHWRLLVLSWALVPLVTAVLFSIVTLPVEWNASARAKTMMVSCGIVSADESDDAGQVLNAAFMTYVAAAVSSLMTLLYYLYRAGVFGGSNRD